MANAIRISSRVVAESSKPVNVSAIRVNPPTSRTSWKVPAAARRYRAASTASSGLANAPRILLRSTRMAQARIVVSGRVRAADVRGHPYPPSGAAVASGIHLHIKARYPGISFIAVAGPATTQPVHIRRFVRAVARADQGSSGHGCLG